MFMGPCILVHNDHISNRRDAAVCALHFVVKLYMFRGHSLIIRSSGNCVCSQVSYSIIRDSVLCLSRAVSVHGFVFPGLVCDGCPLGGVRCELWCHSLFTLC